MKTNEEYRLLEQQLACSKAREDAYRADVVTMTEQIVMLREALDMTQWGDFHFDHYGDGQDYCPECGNQKEQGHTKDCPVGKALAATEPKEQGK